MRAHGMVLRFIDLRARAKVMSDALLNMRALQSPGEQQRTLRPLIAGFDF